MTVLEALSGVNSVEVDAAYAAMEVLKAFLPEDCRDVFAPPPATESSLVRVLNSGAAMTIDELVDGGLPRIHGTSKAAKRPLPTIGCVIEVTVTATGIREL